MSARFHFEDPHDENRMGIIVAWNGSVTFNLKAWDPDEKWWYDFYSFEVHRDEGGLRVEEAFQHARKAAAHHFYAEVD